MSEQYTPTRHARWRVIDGQLVDEDLTPQPLATPPAPEGSAPPGGGADDAGPQPRTTATGRKKSKE